MPTTESIKRKVQTAQELQSVVKSMKAIAAASIKQYDGNSQDVKLVEGTPIIAHKTVRNIKKDIMKEKIWNFIKSESRALLLFVIAYVLLALSSPLLLDSMAIVTGFVALLAGILHVDTNALFCVL